MKLQLSLLLLQSTDGGDKNVIQKSHRKHPNTRVCSHYRKNSCTAVRSTQLLTNQNRDFNSPVCKYKKKKNQHKQTENPEQFRVKGPTDAILELTTFLSSLRLPEAHTKHNHNTSLNQSSQNVKEEGSGAVKNRHDFQKPAAAALDRWIYPGRDGWMEGVLP